MFNNKVSSVSWASFKVLRIQQIHKGGSAYSGMSIQCCAGKCLTVNSLEKGLCSVVFANSCCRYSHLGCLQVTHMISLNAELRRDVLHSC